MLVIVAMAAAMPSAARSELTLGPGKVPFWLELTASRQIDAEVARRLAGEAAVAVVVIRANPETQPPNALSALAKQLRAVAPGLPVFTYSLANRIGPPSSGYQAMKWLASETELQIRSHSGEPLAGFGNVADPRYRSQAASAIAGAVEQAGADGVAIDLAMRTPRVLPQPLARRCEAEPEFCDRYAEGMDALFAEFRGSLGRRPIIYNGLWNFGPGMVEDQAKLLRHADAAIVEYFGMAPEWERRGQDEHRFTKDILPYLQAMQVLPEGKRLFVYGRGPWHYTDYETDYHWQRYLYAAYLLAAGTNTYFKYHASFLVSAPAGRAGALDTYADWKLPLGAPRGEYSLRDGLYTRAFEHGLVLVAPDDGEGGTFSLDKTLYSSEGEKRSGKLKLSPGTGMILLANPPPPLPKNRAFALKILGGDWPAARWIAEGENATYLSLDALDTASVGGHDLLLENERSLSPASVLRVRLRPRSEMTQLLIVTEVDDPERQTNQVVLVSQVSGEHVSGTKPLPGFRAPSRKGENAPFVKGPTLRMGEWQELRLDASEISLGRYIFRGWRYLRFAGPVDVAEVEILRHQNP